MPNWVYNNLLVTGEPADLDVFMHEIALPYTTCYKQVVGMQDGKAVWDFKESTHEACLSFWNAVSPDDLDAYWQKSGTEIVMDRLASIDPAQIVREIREGFETGMDWYNWNVRHWGTKWDACDPEIVREADNTLQYTFNTAWSIPEDAIKAMSVKYPHLEFEIEGIEEQGWGAVMRFKAGAVELVREWDIPETHVEAVAAFGYCSRCSETPDYWYPDCADHYEPSDAEMS